MVDLLLFTLTKKSHGAKLEKLLMALTKKGLKKSPKKCQPFRRNGNIRRILFLLKKGWSV